VHPRDLRDQQIPDLCELGISFSLNIEGIPETVISFPIKHNSSRFYSQQLHHCYELIRIYHYKQQPENKFTNYIMIYIKITKI
jgi:hypothetical protein